MKNSSGYPLLRNKPPGAAAAGAAIIVVFLTVCGSTELSRAVLLPLGLRSLREFWGWNTQDGPFTPPAIEADCEVGPQCLH